MKKKINPEDYIVGPDATIEDIDLDEEVVHYQGERLTEARAALLAEESLHHAALSRATRLRNLVPGRKSLSGGSTHSPALNLRMPQAEFDAFDQLARRRGVKRSTLARQVLEDYLAEHLDELP